MLLRIAGVRARPRLLALVALVAPRLWPALKRGVRDAFDSRALEWDEIVGPLHTAAIEGALESRVLRSAAAGGGAILDVGCGTGLGTDLLCRAFPAQIVVGLDMSVEMLRRASSKVGPNAHRVHWVAGDASRPPLKDSRASLIMLMNAPPFIKSLSEVLKPGGALVFVWSQGRDTPIWINPRLVKIVCRRYGLTDFAEGSAGEGYWIVAAG